MIISNGEWYKAKMISYPGGRPLNCAFRILDGTVSVTYPENGVQLTYSGHEVSEGHFRLVADVVQGKATLHRFFNDRFFEGYWEQDGKSGMWRITVSEQIAS